MCSRWLANLLRVIFTAAPLGEIWQWAEKNVFLTSRQSAEPGYYRSSKTPWTRRIQELARHPWHNGVRVREIYVKKCSQSGFTEALLNIVRWLAKFRPSNCIFAIDSREEAVNVRDRLVDTLERLGAEIFTGDNDDVGKFMLKLRGMIVWFFGSFSAAKFANKFARYCFADEVEEHAVISGDTDTLTNLKSRMKTADDGLMVALSKPKLRGGPIDAAHRTGNQERWIVPCPHCGTFQPLVWERVRFGHCKDLLGQWDKRRVLAETYYECIANGTDGTDGTNGTDGVKCPPILEHTKHAMNEGGRWFPTAMGTPGVVSQEMSDLYSMLKGSSWGNLALEFIDSKGNRRKRQGFYNHRLGLEWSEEISKTEHEDVRRWVRPYKRGTIPFEPVVLLLGADVGLAYARWIVAAVKADGEFAVIDWGSELAPSEVAVLVRDGEWVEAGRPDRKHRISQAFMDAKYRKEDSYAACLSQKLRMWPCAGGATARGKQSFAFGRLPTYPRWFGLLSFNDRDFKTELYIDRMKQGTPRLWFPADTSDDLIEELCHEELVEDDSAPTAGMFTWKRTGPNHYGDCLKLVCVGWRYLTRSRKPEVAKDGNRDDATGATEN